MTPFIIIGLGDFIDNNHLEITVRSFANFYHNVTSKHQKRVELKLIDDRGNIQKIQQLTKYYKIEDVTEILTLDQQEDIEVKYKIASFLLLPLNRKVENIIQESLSYGLPILCYYSTGSDSLLDQTCSMRIDFENTETSVLNFAEVLKLLYFDPEARKIFKKGAVQKYQADYTWGGSNRVRVGA